MKNTVLTGSVRKHAANIVRGLKALQRALQEDIE
jgi:hypothetical protein